MTKDKIEIWYPLKNTILTQGFYENANDWYVTHGMIGHGGYDYVTYYDDKVLFAEDGYVYKIVNKDADLSKFRAVFQLVELENDYILELCYGHANKIYCSNGYYECGMDCMSEGNTGDVWSGGGKVSVEAREKGSKAGTHLHLQGRICKKVKDYSSGFYYLSSQEDETKAYKDDDKYFYRICDYNNGFNGCVPLTFSRYAGDSTIYRKIIELMKQVVKTLKLMQ